MKIGIYLEFYQFFTFTFRCQPFQSLRKNGMGIELKV